MDRLDMAFKKTPRQKFLPDYDSYLANNDMALPIGFGQTNSQPYTVQLMLGWLDPEVGDRILDVGSGSGWTTALLANLVGSTGRVYAVEAIPQLVGFGRNNCLKLGLRNVGFYQAGKRLGLPRFAPYDRILVSAAADDVPQELLNQLASGGKMVIPVKNDILEIEKAGDDIEIIAHPGFVFVPLIQP